MKNRWHRKINERAQTIEKRSRTIQAQVKVQLMRTRKSQLERKWKNNRERKRERDSVEPSQGWTKNYSNSPLALQLLSAHTLPGLWLWVCSVCMCVFVDVYVYVSVYCCEGPHGCPPFQQLDCQLINPPTSSSSCSEGEGREWEELLRAGGRGRGKKGSIKDRRTKRERERE